MDRAFYILIKEQVATRRERNFSIGRQEPPTHVLEGSLWYDSPASSEVDDYRTLDKTILLYSVEYEDVDLKCSMQDVQRLDNTQYNLLHAIDSCGDRFKVYQDTSWMNEAMQMNVDSIVYALKMPGLPDRTPAKVRYRGPLKNKNGLWFGIELSLVRRFL